jgi:hypothetical protein
MNVARTALPLTLLLLLACDKTASDITPVHEPSRAPAPAVPSSASAAPPSPAAPECRATNGTQEIELTLTWDRNIATGTLRTDGKSQPVVAEMYKGLVLVDMPGAKPVTGKLATVTTEGKKTIRLGDYKQPSFDCN